MFRFMTSPEMYVKMIINPHTPCIVENEDNKSYKMRLIIFIFIYLLCITTSVYNYPIYSEKLGQWNIKPHVYNTMNEITYYYYCY